jgi:hypothetical protein
VAMDSLVKQPHCLAAVSQGFHSPKFIFSL